MGDETISPDKEKDWRIWEVGQRGVPLVVFNPLSWSADLQVQLRAVSFLHYWQIFALTILTGR
jgi:hypothetical protein